MTIRLRDISKFSDLAYYEFTDPKELLNGKIREGLNSLKQGESWFDFIFEDRGSPVTLVTFTAAVPESAPTFPIFSSRGIADRLGVNYLAFADSSSGSPNNLPTFWHLGNQDVNSQNLIPEIIENIKESTRSNLLFFGASAGGFAALHYSRNFDNSAVLVLNPRICLLHHPKRMPKYTPINFPDRDPIQAVRSLPHDQSRLYKSEHKNHVFYIQNLQDENYKRHHYAHFHKATSDHENVVFITGKWGAGHVVPPRDVYIDRLRDLAASAPEWRINHTDDHTDVDYESAINRAISDGEPENFPELLLEYLQGFKTLLSKDRYLEFINESISLMGREKDELSLTKEENKDLEND